MPKFIEHSFDEPLVYTVHNGSLNINLSNIQNLGRMCDIIWHGPFHEY